MSRSIVKCKFVSHQLVFCGVDKNPIEFSSSSRNIIWETLIQVNIIFNKSIKRNISSKLIESLTSVLRYCYSRQM